MMSEKQYTEYETECQGLIDLEKQAVEIKGKLEQSLLRDLTDEDVRTLHAYESWQDGLSDWDQVKSLWKDEEGLDREARIQQLIRCFDYEGERK